MRRIRRYGFVVLAGGAVAAVAALAAVPIVAEWYTPTETYPESNYSRIEDGLYLGGMLPAPPPGTAAVLNVCETEDPYRLRHHKWSPIRDIPPAPSLDWLREQVAFVEDQRREGRTVYVHCRAGVSRSALVVVAYLMRRDGLSRDDTLARVRTRRVRAGPNPAFLALLNEWEKVAIPKGE